MNTLESSLKGIESQLTVMKGRQLETQASFNSARVLEVIQTALKEIKEENETER